MGTDMDWTHAAMAAITAVVVAGAAVLVAYFNSSRRLMGRVDELTTQLFGLQDKVFKLQEESADCRTREADLKGDLARAQHRIADLEAKIGVVVKSEFLPGIVIINTKGHIQEFSPSVTGFLGWTPSEMTGQIIDRMTTPEMYEIIVAAIRGAIIDPTKQYPTYALDRNGGKVAVMLAMRRWEGPEAFVTVTMAPRGRENGKT